jgi:hypothetical protein
MSNENGANSEVLGITQRGEISNTDMKPMGNEAHGETGEMVVADVMTKVTMNETTAEIKMGASSSND